MLERKPEICFRLAVSRKMKSLGHSLSVAVAVACTLLLFFGGGAHGSYCYDHQRETYNARFKPATCGSCTVTPFFSPDTSVEAYVQLIESAAESIDVYTPSMESWTEACTKDTNCPKKGTCTGCSIDEQKKEPFPVFPALLNAVHERGVKIRIITNNFTFSACEDRVVPLDWLALNGIEIQMYATTTFIHSKFIMIDKGAKTAVSSVNWSKTSFTRNREAGVILEDCSCSAISLYQSVFDYDWDTGTDYVVTRSYNESEKRAITDTAYMPYPIIPSNSSIPESFVTQLIPHRDVKVEKAYTTDYARETLMTYLNSTQRSLNLAVYQVTDEGLCDKLLELHKRGINVTLLVSCHVIPYYNYMKANECYGNLTKGGMAGHVQCAYSKFEFSHEKYWIIDGTTVHLSTGNWSPSDFPNGTSWEPHKESINRDLEIVLEQADLVEYFYKVYGADWAMGTEWKPKT